MANKRLGRGLDSIFGEDVNALIEEIQSGKDGYKQIEIDIDSIRPNPYQPRKVFDDKALKELSESIKEHGIFSALIVRKSINDGYELIAGERRLRAAKIAKLKTVPCVVVDFNDTQMMEVSLLENIQRENLNPIEEAVAYKNIMDKLNYTQEKLSHRVGKTREYVANILRLLNLPKSVQDLVIENKITMSHARPLLGLDDEDLIYDLALKIIDNKMSVRDVERMVKEFSGKTSAKVKKKEDPNLNYVRSLFENKLQTKVKISTKKIEISYNDIHDLNRILEILGVVEDGNIKTE